MYITSSSFEYASESDVDRLYVVRCTTWHHWYNLKNMKNTHGGVFFLVKLQAKTCNFTKSNTPSCVFSRFLNCTDGTKSRKALNIISFGSDCGSESAVDQSPGSTGPSQAVGMMVEGSSVIKIVKASIEAPGYSAAKWIFLFPLQNSIFMFAT